MQLQDLNPGDLLRYITACRKLIAGYKGEVEPLDNCPLCIVTDDIETAKDVRNKSCTVCLWEILDKMNCTKFEMYGYYGPQFAISAIRHNPTMYPNDALRCIERLERWIVALENELATRG